MHELSLCQSAVEIIQRQAEQHDVKRVTAVWLEIGALSCVEESAVRFSFEIVCHGTVAQGCDLHIVYKPARAQCWDCSGGGDSSARCAVSDLSWRAVACRYRRFADRQKY